MKITPTRGGFAAALAVVLVAFTGLATASAHEKPTSDTADWQFRFQVKFLFPE